jgi:hypothetical protein
VHKLPPHTKCASHLLNLVAIKNARKTDGVARRTSTQTFAKFTGVWNKQNRSYQAAEMIKNAIGTLLVTPGDTRRNSTYDAVSKVTDINCNPELTGKFDNVCDELVRKHLPPAQNTFVQEYVEVIAPITV